MNWFTCEELSVARLASVSVSLLRSDEGLVKAAGTAKAGGEENGVWWAEHSLKGEKTVARSYRNKEEEMGVWSSCGCPGRLLKMEDHFPLYLGMLSFCRWVSFFYQKPPWQESVVICIKVIKESFPFGDAFFHEWWGWGVAGAPLVIMSLYSVAECRCVGCINGVWDLFNFLQHWSAGWSLPSCSSTGMK